MVSCSETKSSSASQLSTSSDPQAGSSLACFTYGSFGNMGAITVHFRVLSPKKMTEGDF